MAIRRSNRPFVDSLLSTFTDKAEDHTAPMKSPCPNPRVVRLIAAAVLMVVPPATAATVAQNSIGNPADGQSITLDIESAPGFRFTLGETTQIESIEITLTQSSGAFAVVFLQTYSSTLFPGSWLVIAQHPMLMNPSDVVMFDPPLVDGPTNVTIPYPTVLPAGEYILSFNILAENSTHTFLAHESVAGSEGVQWAPDWNPEHTNYGTVTWSDTTLQPDIRINGTVIPEPSVTLLAPLFAGLLIQQRKQRAP